jgi:hypothetical protein
MIARGHVHEGVVHLDDGVRIPEGQEVTVLAPDKEQVGVAIEGAPRHGILDIPPVSLGQVLRPSTANDDLLGEMLEGRP